MSLCLILTRHAKSDWDNSALDDHDRTLNERGRRAASRLGAWVAEHATIPREALVSTATRAVQTWEGMAPALPGCEITFVNRLYHAAPQTMLKVLAAARQDCVLMIGHNPGIAMFAAGLLRTQPDHARFAAYPTAATLVATFEIADWTELEPGSGTAVDFVVPRDLA